MTSAPSIGCRWCSAARQGAAAAAALLQLQLVLPLTLCLAGTRAAAAQQRWAAWQDHISAWP
jgi:hypothetical protein